MAKNVYKLYNIPILDPSNNKDLTTAWAMQYTKSMKINNETKTVEIKGSRITLSKLAKVALWKLENLGYKVILVVG